MKREFDKKLLEYLICPITGESLLYDEDQHLLINISKTHGYKVKDGIPIMNQEEVLILRKE